MAADVASIRSGLVNFIDVNRLLFLPNFIVWNGLVSEMYHYLRNFTSSSSGSSSV